MSGTPRREQVRPGTSVPVAFPLIRAKEGPPGMVEDEAMYTSACVSAYCPVLSRLPGECTSFCGVLFFEWEIGDPQPPTPGGWWVLSLQGRKSPAPFRVGLCLYPHKYQPQNHLSMHLSFSHSSRFYFICAGLKFCLVAFVYFHIFKEVLILRTLPLSSGQMWA